MMPVIFIKAIPVDRMDTKNVYECPVYKTRMRGPTYVWTFNPKLQLCFFQKKFLIRGVTSFTHSFTCRLGCSNVDDDTTPEQR